MTELYKKHRPATLAEMVGQDDVVSMLQKMIENKSVPHTTLFTGPSGCGKTTLARILCTELGCGEYDITEVNCADFRGIEMVRDIRSMMVQSPISGNARVWIIDEAHRLTTDGQNAFLKILEDTPSHVYFMLATTDPHRLIKTIRTRCTEIAVKSLERNDLYKLVLRICKKEKKKVLPKILKKLCINSEGSARKALVYLHQIIDMDDPKSQYAAVSKSAEEAEAIEIARGLFNTKNSWKDMRAILKNVKLDEPETIRHIVLGYAKTILLNGGYLEKRAFNVIMIFSTPFYESHQAGLVAACYEIFADS